MYECYYWVDYDRPIRDSEKDEMNKSLLNLSLALGKEHNMDVKKIDKTDIRLRKGKLVIYNHFDPPALHFHAFIEEKNTKDLELSNTISNSVVAFASNLSGRTMKRIRMVGELTKDLQHNILEPFVKLIDIVQLSGKLRLRIRPTVFGFDTKKDEWDVFVMFGYRRKGRCMITIRFRKPSKEEKWDLATKTYKDIKDFHALLLSTLGGGKTG